MSTTTLTNVNALMMSSETGLFLTFGTIIFMVMFIILLYMFWEIKK